MADKLDKPQEAIEYAERAAAINGEANVLDTLGWAYVRSGQVEKGIGKLFQARQADATHVPSSYHLAEAYRMNDEFDDAIKLLTEVLQETKPVDGRESRWSDFREPVRESLEKAKNGDSN